ncbi:pyridine nucleotide-disulfide oxidoreductase [Oleiphilus messinensis]|uniref:Dihydrolipoyl dehydrogenase n=1 Tax=Oleiphilus messinensis TaxID=141451 RepID=A0A1Y0IF86_9GAMM|nr:dihydrolipoyl dehydrogenase [Oleiphilus messinensis]ARU58900.1 pyridine nucleotide-disulfide oxidoreductase [Oleiphilus messinensis]
MTQYQYNLVIIGGGTAGLITANVAAQAKAKVALIEKHKMGGDCLNTGCVPSKALLSSAKQVDFVRRSGEFGIHVENYKIDFPKIMEQVHGIIKTIAPIDSVERYTELGCDCYEAAATILSSHQVQVGEEILTTDHIVVATGGTPFIPPIPGIADLEILHSDNLWDLQELPKRLLVVGSGPIGCELSQAFSRLGSEVTIISQDPGILSREDLEVSQLIENAFTQEGIKLRLKTSILQFKANANGAGCVHLDVDGQPEVIEFDRVLIAAGRKANTAGIGLDQLGVELNSNGSIKVDSQLRTSIPHIWACGDAVGPYQFTHMAAHQAGYVALNILAHPFKRFKVDYSQVPWVTYVDPEVARCGLNETEAKAQGIPYEVTQFHFSHQDRALTERANKGFIKVLTVPRKDTILGVTICGPHGGELLAEFSLAIKNKLGLKAIMNTIHPYPTFSEANKSVALEWRKKYLPKHLLKYAKSYFAWKRHVKVS